jgi:hypothetical protein
MKVKRFASGDRRRAACCRLTTIVAITGFFWGACSRQQESWVPPTSVTHTPIPAVYSPADGAPISDTVNISYAGIVNRVARAVVTIHSQSRGRAPQQFPYSDDPSFQDLFGERGRSPQPPVER